MASIQTLRGKFHYKELSIFIPEKKFDRDVAFDNFKVLVNVMKNAGIRVSPAYGTLLGIIRENNFIEWDHDIDLFILKEDKEKFLESLWVLRENGFELFRAGRSGYLYSIMRNEHYIDFYIMENISPEVRTSFGEFFLLDRFLTDLREWNFRGVTINIPKDYEECLEFLYGDWKTPIRYEDESIKSIKAFKIKINNWVKNKIKSLLPIRLRLKLQKKHHRDDLNRFLKKCEMKGIILKYEINY